MACASTHVCGGVALAFSIGYRCLCMCPTPLHSGKVPFAQRSAFSNIPFTTFASQEQYTNFKLQTEEKSSTNRFYPQLAGKDRSWLACQAKHLLVIMTSLKLSNIQIGPVMISECKNRFGLLRWSSSTLAQWYMFSSGGIEGPGWCGTRCSDMDTRHVL